MLRCNEPVVLNPGSQSGRENQVRTACPFLDVPFTPNVRENRFGAQRRAACGGRHRDDSRLARLRRWGLLSHSTGAICWAMRLGFSAPRRKREARQIRRP